MRKAFIPAITALLVADVSVVAGGVSSALRHSHGLAGNTHPMMITYHKSGNILVKDVLSNCLTGKAFHGRDTWFRPNPHWAHTAVIFVRDPKALVRSAYDYHKTAKEPWLHLRGWSIPAIDNDPVVGPSRRQDESYSAYLNRVPFEMGFRAEFLRSATHQLAIMVPSVENCKSTPSSCTQVCLEQFTKSSKSYDHTWKIILDAVGLDHSYMKCIQGYDLNSWKYIGGHENHATNTTASEIADSYELFAKLDKQLMNNTYTLAGEAWKCALRPSMFALDGLQEEIVTEEIFADAHA